MALLSNKEHDSTVQGEWKVLKVTKIRRETKDFEKSIMLARDSSSRPAFILTYELLHLCGYLNRIQHFLRV
jgi:hypothetical protein